MRVDSGAVSLRDLGREKWLGRILLASLWIVAGAFVALARDRTGSPVACGTPMFLMAGTSLLLALRPGRSAAGDRRRGVAGTVAFVDDAMLLELVTGRRARFARADLASGWTEPAADGAAEVAVLRTTSGAEIRIALPAAAHGPELLRAAGVAPEQRAVKIPVLPGDVGLVRAAVFLSATVVVPIALICAAETGMAMLEALTSRVAEPLALAAFSAVGALVSGGSAWILLQRLATTTVTIGTDGVVIEQLGRRRRVPRGDVRSVLAHGGAVVLARAGGPAVRLYSSPAAAATVAARIQAALQVTGEAPAAPLERLDRRERPIAAWLADLRALAGAHRGYRDASLDRDDLFAVVKDGAAAVERRIAAAAALSSRPDEEGKAALRIAAATCSDERLRVVLGHAAEAELGEEEVEEALARVGVAR